MGAFATHDAEGFSEVRDEVAAMRFDFNEVSVRMDKAEGAATTAATSASVAANDAGEALRSMDDMQKAIDAMSSKVERLATSATTGSATQGPARKLARIRGSGWDVDPKKLESRATALLLDSGIRRDVFGPVGAVVNKAGLGSSAETVFATVDALEDARIAVWALRRSFGASTPAWVDVARTRAETRPLRMVHRIADMLEDCTPCGVLSTCRDRWRARSAVCWAGAGTVQRCRQTPRRTPLGSLHCRPQTGLLGQHHKRGSSRCNKFSNRGVHGCSVRCTLMRAMRTCLLGPRAVLEGLRLTPVGRPTALLKCSR